MQGGRPAGPRAARGGLVCRMPAAQGKQAVEKGGPQGPGRTSAPRPSCPLLTPAGGHRCPKSKQELLESLSPGTSPVLRPLGLSLPLPGPAAARGWAGRPPGAPLTRGGSSRGGAPGPAGSEEETFGEALGRRKPGAWAAPGEGGGLGVPSGPAGRAPAWAGPPARGRRPGRRRCPSGARPGRGPRAAAPSAGLRAGRSPPGPRSGSGRTGGP